MLLAAGVAVAVWQTATAVYGAVMPGRLVVVSWVCRQGYAVEVPIASARVQHAAFGDDGEQDRRALPPIWPDLGLVAQADL